MSNLVAHIDFETRSRVNLIAHGAYAYARDPSTQVICLAWAFGDDAEPEIWYPGLPFPQAIVEHIESGGIIHAHNAGFERLIFWYVLCPDFDIPEPKLEQFYCTSAQARCRALPAGLDDLGRCLGLASQKSKRGKELIKLLCVPNKETNDFSYDPDLMQEMYEYCLQDVRVERAAAQCTPPMTEIELTAYHNMERINDRGMLVDVEFAKAAANYAALEVEELCAKINAATNGRINTPRQYAKIKEFALDLGGEPARKAMTTVTTNRQTGEEERKLSFGKDNRRQLRLMAEEDPNLFPYSLTQLIELTDEAGRSSVAKFNNMVKRADAEDDRVRGAYICFGAGQTGRASSVGLQVHNLPRKVAKNSYEVRRWVIEDRELPGGVMDTLSSMLRPSIIAPEGRSFICGDWSAIEARVLPWLSDSKGGRKVLDVFATVDADPDAPDIYMMEAAKLFDIDAADVTKDQRAIGKVEVLALGYQGGYRAFQAMARGYGITVSDEEAEKIKVTWRSNNGWAEEFWKDVDRAAKDAVIYSGVVTEVGRMKYFCKGEGQSLFCQLPSGRVLSYPQIRIDEGTYGPELSAIKAQWKPKQGETEWPRITLYGGLLAENCTQAASADILYHAVNNVIGAGLDVVGTTHDEILCETASVHTAADEKSLERLMLAMPLWAEGLPMAVETWSGKKYRK